MWVDLFLWSAIGYLLWGEQTCFSCVPTQNIGVAQDGEEQEGLCVGEDTDFRLEIGFYFFEYSQQVTAYVESERERLKIFLNLAEESGKSHPNNYPWFLS